MLSLASASARAEGAGTPQGSPDAEVVSIRFGWQAANVADVTERRERLSGGTSVGSAELHYVLRVRAEGGELVVEHEDVAPAPPAPGGLVLPEPSIRVARDGGFVSVVDAEALRARTRAVLTAQLGERAGEGAALIESATQPALLEARARGEWNLLVENWAGGRAYALGAVYQLSAHEERPEGGVQLRYEIGANRRVPCSPSETRLRCVELGMRWSPVPEHVERALRENLAGVIPENTKVAEPALRNEVLLVAEPDTLLPHLYQFRRVTSGVLERDAERERFEIVERAERSYAWRLVRE